MRRHTAPACSQNNNSPTGPGCGNGPHRAEPDPELGPCFVADFPPRQRRGGFGSLGRLQQRLLLPGCTRHGGCCGWWSLWKTVARSADLQHSHISGGNERQAVSELGQRALQQRRRLPVRPSRAGRREGRARQRRRWWRWQSRQGCCWARCWGGDMLRTRRGIGRDWRGCLTHGHMSCLYWGRLACGRASTAPLVPTSSLVASTSNNPSLSPSLPPSLAAEHLQVLERRPLLIWRQLPLLARRAQRWPQEGQEGHRCRHGELSVPFSLLPSTAVTVSRCHRCTRTTGWVFSQ